MSWSVRVRGSRHSRTLHAVNYDALVVEVLESRLDRRVGEPAYAFSFYRD